MPHYIDGDEVWTPAEVTAYSGGSNPWRDLARAGVDTAGVVLNEETGHAAKVWRRSEVEAALRPATTRRTVRPDGELLDELARKYPDRVPSLGEIRRTTGVGSPRDKRIRALYEQRLEQEAPSSGENPES